MVQVGVTRVGQTVILVAWLELSDEGEDSRCAWRCSPKKTRVFNQAPNSLFLACR